MTKHVRVDKAASWCILRMSGRNTLAIAESLAGEGLDVWTPTKAVLMRQRKPGPRPERLVPIMPTFVFARASHIPALSMIEEDPTTQHEQFSIFRYYRRIPLLADRELESLRDEEHRCRRDELRRRPAPAFRGGETVKAEKGAFAGMSGIVQRANGKHVMVLFALFGRTMEVEIEAFHFLDAEAYTVTADPGTAAQAA